MNKRTKAKATLAESTARVLVYLSETVLINQIDINPFEVEVPFSKTLVPTVKKLLTFVTVTGTCTLFKINVFNSAVSQTLIGPLQGRLSSWWNKSEWKAIRKYRYTRGSFYQINKVIIIFH